MSRPSTSTRKLPCDAWCQNCKDIGGEILINGGCRFGDGKIIYRPKKGADTGGPSLGVDTSSRKLPCDAWCQNCKDIGGEILINGGCRFGDGKIIYRPKKGADTGGPSLGVGSRTSLYERVRERNGGYGSLGCAPQLVSEPEQDQFKQIFPGSWGVGGRKYECTCGCPTGMKPSAGGCACFPAKCQACPDDEVLPPIPGWYYTEFKAGWLPKNLQGKSQICCPKPRPQPPNRRCPSGYRWEDTPDGWICMPEGKTMDQATISVIRGAERVGRKRTPRKRARNGNIRGSFDRSGTRVQPFRAQNPDLKCAAGGDIVCEKSGEKTFSCTCKRCRKSSGVTTCISYKPTVEGKGTGLPLGLGRLLPKRKLRTRARARSRARS